MKNIDLKVVGNNTMRCGGCENSVKFVLSDLVGVEQVEAHHRTQLVYVVYDEGQIDQERLVEELATLGYQAKPMV